jgi:hypothetical protein
MKRKLHKISGGKKLKIQERKSGANSYHSALDMYNKYAYANEIDSHIYFSIFLVNYKITSTPNTSCIDFFCKNKTEMK